MGAGPGKGVFKAALGGPGGAGRSFVDVSVSRALGTAFEVALELGRARGRGTAGGPLFAGGYFGVATSVPSTLRGIFLGCGGFIIAIQRPILLKGLS